MSSIEALMTPAEVSQATTVTVKTLSKWRSTKDVDLPYVKFGKKVLYRADDVNQFIKRNTVSGGSEL